MRETLLQQAWMSFYTDKTGPHYRKVASVHASDLADWTGQV